MNDKTPEVYNENSSEMYGAFKIRQLEIELSIQRAAADELKNENQKLKETINEALDEERCVIPKDRTSRTEQILMMAEINPGKCLDCGCNTWNSRSGYCQKCKRLRIKSGDLSVDPNDQHKFDTLRLFAKKAVELLRNCNTTLYEISGEFVEVRGRCREIRKDLDTILTDPMAKELMK